MINQNPSMIAAIKISRLEKLTGKTVALMPADFFKCSLKAERVVRTPEHVVLWFHVDRIKYIEYLKNTNNICRKREVNVRNRIRK